MPEPHHYYRPQSVYALQKALVEAIEAPEPPAEPEPPESGGWFGRFVDKVKKPK